MLRETYLALKERLKTKLPEVKEITWDMAQYEQIPGEDVLHITPALLIKFNPVTWQTQPGNLQRAVLEFEITLINDTAYGDERDITDTQYINHLAMESKVFKYLMNHRILLSDVPGMSALKNTANDAVLLESIVRTNTRPHDELDVFVRSTQVFQSTIFDYSATPVWQTILATLDCDMAFQ